MGRIKTSVFNMKETWLYFFWGIESVIAFWIFFMSGQFFPLDFGIFRNGLRINWAAIISMVIAALVSLVLTYKDLNIPKFFNKLQNGWKERKAEH